MFLQQLVIVIITLWGVAFAHTSTTSKPTTEAGSGSDQCLAEYSTCTESEWETYTVLKPPKSQSDIELHESVDELQNKVDKILNLIEQNVDVSEDHHIYRDCQEIFTNGFYEGDGVYFIYPNASSQPFKVYCEQDADGVWTVIQKRTDSQADFHLHIWEDYKAGFGSVDGSHWLGNQKIREITSSCFYTYTLRVDLGDWEGNSAYADYDSFLIEGENDKYRLRLGIYSTSGTAGDSLGFNNNMQFTTRDDDNDFWSNGNCATLWGKGAWWHRNCFDCNLNQEYWPNSTASEKYGLQWEDWKGPFYSLKSSTMKIKPKNRI